MCADKSSPDIREQILREAGIEPADLPDSIDKAIWALAGRVGLLTEKTQELEAALQAASALADQDPLCPLFNRRAFLRELSREIAVAQRHGSELSVIFLDLVSFKRINDQFGHAAGDEVLKAVAAVLLANTRQTDITGRLGGDEFAIALPRASYVDALAKADELGEILGRTPMFPNQPTGERTEPVAASFGCATWTPGMDADNLLAAADRALYHSRTAPQVSSSGRGRS